ncbi:hypothetical protein RQP46_010886 [Phenoliferia psychrophenolica]
MASINSLPPEIISGILTLVATRPVKRFHLTTDPRKEYYPLLRTLCLVSRLFKAIAQARLFRHVIIDGSRFSFVRSGETQARLLLSSSALGQHPVKTLSLYKLEIERAAIVIQRCGSLGLHSLSLERMDVDARVVLSAGPDLKSLEIIECNSDFLNRESTVAPAPSSATGGAWLPRRRYGVRLRIYDHHHVTYPTAFLGLAPAALETLASQITSLGISDRFMYDLIPTLLLFVSLKHLTIATDPRWSSAPDRFQMLPRVGTILRAFTSTGSTGALKLEKLTLMISSVEFNRSDSDLVKVLESDVVRDLKVLSLPRIGPAEWDDFEEGIPRYSTRFRSSPVRILLDGDVAVPSFYAA